MTDNHALLDLDVLPDVFAHHVARVTDLVALGVTGAAIEERCRGGGPWRRMEPDLVLLAQGPPSREQRIQAALTVAGPGAVLTGVDALALHGMSAARLDGPVHLLVPARRRPGLVDGVLFEPANQLPEPRHLSGFPVAPLPRATIDTCRRANQAEHVRALLTEAIQDGHLPPAVLREELRRTSTRGTALPRRILAEMDDDLRSVTQVSARRLVLKAGLPMPRWRVPLTSQNGAHVATADAWWDDVGLAWEVDSYAFDLSPTDMATMLRRATTLTVTGIVVVHTPPHQLHDDPAAVADLLRAAYEQAAARPRPQVKAA